MNADAAQSVPVFHDAASDEDDDPGSCGAAPDAPLEVELSLPGGDTDPPAKGYLEPRVRDACRELGVTAASLSLVALPDEEMAAAHAHHLGDPTPTDVMTFDLRDDGAAADAPLDAEVLLGLDVARREAAARGHETRAELLLYAVHGVLHLLGEDDHTDAGYGRMHRREDAVLTAIGLGPIFAGRDADDRPAADGPRRPPEPRDQTNRYP